MEAKLTAVTNPTECKRRFGRNRKTATVTGVVINVVTPEKGSGKQASLVVDWNVETYVNRKEVKIINVRLPTNQPGQSTLDQGEETEDEQYSHGVDYEVITTNNAQVTLLPGEAAAHGYIWRERDSDKKRMDHDDYSGDYTTHRRDCSNGPYRIFETM